MVFGIGSLLLSNAKTVECLMIGRFVVGWAVAVSGIADVTYLHEISSVWEKRDGDYCRESRNATEEVGADGELSTRGGPSAEEVIVAADAHSNGVGGRGSVVSVNEACISLGFLLAYGVAAVGGSSRDVPGDANDQASDAWRVMFGCAGLLAALQFVGMLCMPESPVWLHEKGRVQDAISARNVIRGICSDSGDKSESGSGTHRHGTNGDSSNEKSYQKVTQNRSESDDFEMHVISPISSEEEEQNVPSRFYNPNAVDCIVCLWINICSAPSQMKVNCRRILQYRNQFIIAFFLATSQQFCGHPSILSFAPEIFAMLSQPPQDDQAVSENGVFDNSANAAALTPIELTVVIGVLKFLTTCLVILFVERAGRRLWLLSGMSCILLSLTFLYIALSGRDGDGIRDDSFDDTQQYSSSLKNRLGYVGVYGVAIGYAASFGPLTWLIVSEIFPSSIRGRALGFATVVTYMAAGLVSNTFLTIQEKFGLSTCIALYWTSTFVSIGFVCMAVPDTGGDKSPEQIESELKRKWIWGGKGHGRRSDDGQESQSRHTPSTIPRFYGGDQTIMT